MISSSVVICAYTVERWEDILAAVESVLDSRHQPEQVLLVVDHNDVLLTRAAEHFRRRSALVQVLANQRRRGLSGSRNTALGQVTQDVVVFLDDDAAAQPGWLAQLLVHFEDPAVIAVGGSAVPAWPGSSGGRPALFPAAPGKLHGEFDWVVGCTFEGQPTSTAPVRNLMGCNMSFRRSVFDAVGGFNEDLGRIGRTPLGGEETELCIRAHRNHAESLIVFEPSAAVRHRVTEDRVRWRYLMSRCYSEGLSKASVATMVGQAAALETERSYTTRVLPRALLRELVTAARGRSSGAVGAAAIVCGLTSTVVGYARGRLNQVIKHRPDRQPQPAAVS